jgi:predicted GNAT family N-acyltransferase
MSDAPLILTVPLFSQLGNLGMALRREVFVHEQHVPAEEEFDAYDLTATHVVALADGDVAGALRILFLPDHAKFGRVAVSRAARGRGIATAMMRFAMDLARARGETRFYLTAQTDKLALYEKLGFVAFGGEFQDGGMPHLAMRNY